MTEEYNFRIKPRSYQQYAFEQMQDKHGFAILWQMRLGKTKAAIDNLCYLYSKGLIDSAVIVVRKSIIGTWVEDELPKHLWDVTDTKIFKWNGLGTAREREYLKYVKNFEGLKIYVINIEAFSSISEANRKRIGTVFDGIETNRAMVIVDEATDIKTPDSNRTKWITNIFKPFKYKRILTGTPIAERPEDAYSIFKFLDDKFWDFGSYWAFKNYYCIYKDMRLGNRTFKKLIGYRNLKGLSDKILDPKISSRYTMKQVVDELPEKIYKTISVELSSAQRKHYKEMVKSLYTEIGSDSVEVLSAVHKYMKLHQIACGTVHMKESDHVIEESNERIEAVFDLIDEQLPDKVVVFSMLSSTVTVDWLHDKLSERYGSEAVVKYTGDTKPEDRQSIIRSFQDPDSTVKIFVGNQAAKMGIKLYPCNLMIFYSNDYSYATREQAEMRCDDVDNKNSVCIVDIVAQDTEDKRITEALGNKRNIIDIVMSGRE